MARSRESDARLECTVAWMGSVPRGWQLGRGQLQCARHSPDSDPPVTPSRLVLLAA